MNKGAQTRQRLLAEAAKLFNQRGYAGGSMLELMKATGLEKGGIYRHFSSKEDLAAEAFDYAWRQAFELRSKGLGDIPHAVDKLKHLIDNFAEKRSPIPGGCPLLNTAVEADDGNLVLRKRASAALREWKDRLICIVLDGLHQKQVKAEVDAAQTADLIISCLEGALMITRLEHKPDALQTARGHLHAHLEASIRL